MNITGEMLIGKSAVCGRESIVRALDPALGTELEPSFGGGAVAEVDHACSLAASWKQLVKEFPISAKH